MNPVERPRPPAASNFAQPPMRALDERRIDPGTARRENIDTRSPLSTMVPRGRDNTGMPAREPVKR